MKLALTLEADSVNVQALNMGRIVVDVDGVELAELINRRATGLMIRDNYRTVNNITLGKHPEAKR